MKLQYIFTVTVTVMKIVQLHYSYITVVGNCLGCPRKIHYLISSVHCFFSDCFTASIPTSTLKLAWLALSSVSSVILSSFCQAFVLNIEVLNESTGDFPTFLLGQLQLICAQLLCPTCECPGCIPN